VKITPHRLHSHGNFLLTASSDVMASEFSWDSKFCTIGGYKYDVLRKRGQPSHLEVWKEVRIKRDFESSY